MMTTILFLNDAPIEENPEQVMDNISKFMNGASGPAEGRWLRVGNHRTAMTCTSCSSA